MTGVAYFEAMMWTCRKCELEISLRLLLQMSNKPSIVGGSIHLKMGHMLNSGNWRKLKWSDVLAALPCSITHTHLMYIVLNLTC